MAGTLSTLLPARLRLRRVMVSGPSMVPALRDGDTVLARVGATVRPGDVVLARFRDLPDRLVVKRAVRPDAGGWWLESDNPFAGGDSSVHGPADVEARVLLVLSPGRPRRVPGRPAGPLPDARS